MGGLGQEGLGDGAWDGLWQRVTGSSLGCPDEKANAKGPESRDPLAARLSLGWGIRMDSGMEAGDTG